MDLDILFEGVGENNKTLWTRLQEFADELDLQPEDRQVFVTDESLKMSFYINSYLHNMVSVGTHLARIKKVKNKLESKLQKIFDKEYIAVTDSCVTKTPGSTANTTSSKFDQNYRAGKARNNEKYRECSDMLADITELEGKLTSWKDCLHVKSMVLPSMFKLDKTQY